MLQQTPLNPENCYRPQPSNAVSWLGFGLSLFVLFMEWGVFVLASSDDVAGMSLFFLFILIGGFMWILGLIFSIKGFLTASRYSMPIRSGLCGIIFSCLTLASPFILAAISTLHSHSETVIKSSEEKVYSESITKQPSKTSGTISRTEECDIIFVVDRFGEIRCYDNRKGRDRNPIKMGIINQGEQIEAWLEMKGLNKNTPIAIKINKDADYYYFTKLVDELKEIGVRNYKVVDPD